MGSNADVAVHIVHQTDNIAGYVSYTANGFRAMTGLQAFRRYNWMTDARSFNSVGDFRGMVISARWGTAYEVIAPAAKALGGVATVASVAANLIDMAPQFESVYRSNENPWIKGVRYVSLADTVVQKTLVGTITGGVHLIYLPLIVGCDAVAKAADGRSIKTAAEVCSEVVRNADSLVRSSADYITDPLNQQKWTKTVFYIDQAN